MTKTTHTDTYSLDNKVMRVMVIMTIILGLATIAVKVAALL